MSDKQFIAAMKCYASGTAVKSTGNPNQYGGYLIRWGSPTDTDLENEFFSPDTDLWLDFEDYVTLPVLYDHGQSKALGKHKMGRARLVKDDIGVRAIWTFTPTTEHEKVIEKYLKSGDVFGWSSGSAGHLADRVAAGSARKITDWPLVEASITPRPADWRNMLSALTVAQKSVNLGDFERELLNTRQAYIHATSSRVRERGGLDAMILQTAEMQSKLDQAIETMRSKGYNI